MGVVRRNDLVIEEGPLLLLLPFLPEFPPVLLLGFVALLLEGVRVFERLVDPPIPLVFLVISPGKSRLVLARGGNGLLERVGLLLLRLLLLVVVVLGLRVVLFVLLVLLFRTEEERVDDTL